MEFRTEGTAMPEGDIVSNVSVAYRPGETCWRVAKADRFAVIIDAANYFAALKSAALKAQHTIMFIGWDFDTRVDLDPLKDDDAPSEFGDFLKWIVKEKPDLKLYILKWDLGIFQTLGRGTMPLTIFNMMTDKNITIKLDGAHPSGSAHHQKIAVIDDSLAFCGGIDITADRWDTREHLDEHPGRVRPTSGRHYGPWHDTTTAVDGEAARALGDLARIRWHAATGVSLDPPPKRDDAVWPDDLPALVRDVDVAISRTRPEYGETTEISEIKELKLAVIRAAKKTLYIESQYFASRILAEAMAERLQEPDGPEIVIITPFTADGWLEEKAMGAARARMMDLVRKADIHDRFRIYVPVTANRNPIYVHSKVLTMDDRLLRVGSSNLNNRSLGFDTECDLSIEALPDTDNADHLRTQIISLRNDLLAEHLDVENDHLADTIAAKGGSLIATIEELRTESGRSLVPFEPPEFADLTDITLAESNILDPEHTRTRVRFEEALRRLLS